MAFALCCSGGPIVLKSSECMPAVVSASARTAPTATAATGRRPARLRLLAAISRGAITNGSNPSIQRRASEARKPPIITLITRALVMRAGHAAWSVVKPDQESPEKRRAGQCCVMDPWCGEARQRRRAGRDDQRNREAPRRTSGDAGY
jgi:hypothetical protein